MKKLILKTILLFISFTALSQNTATYDIVFTSNWEAHGTLPNSAHFSDLVGVTHNSTITFLEMGELATPGIEDIAEIGVTEDFSDEVTAAINDNKADQYIPGPSLFFRDGPERTITINDVIVAKDYPLLSMASMLAPSPDWMIAINSLSLLDANGQWISEIIMDLYPYDAGTEEGTTYSINNDPTIPQETITDIRGMYTFSDEKVGTIVITQNILSVDEFQNTKEKITISPNPSDGNISVSSKKASTIKEIEVYNVLGKKVRRYDFKQSNANINLDLTQLNAGIYLVKLYTNLGQTETQKIILR